MENWENASVHFCENKYEKYYIAEYYNTVSSLCYVMVGIAVMQTRLRFLGQLLCCVGFGAMLLHATLLHASQMGDEMSMLALGFYSLKELRPQTSKYLIYPLLITYCLFSKYFGVFFITFVGIQILTAKHAHGKINNKNRKWIILYFVSFISGTICWVLDQVCRTHFGWLEQYQMHAWWHFFTAAATGFGYMAILHLKSPRLADFI
jgi:hypothetical protein